MRKSVGFTLIEILIVVAIIAILSAIAVPNFLEAQTRSKVSRARADLHTIALSLEVYHTDENCYPPMCENWYADKWRDDSHFTGKGLHDVVPNYLTTPVAYMTKIPYDLFRSGWRLRPGYSNEDCHEFSKRYCYRNTSIDDGPGSELAEENVYYQKLSGKWFLYSTGPDESIVGSRDDIEHPNGLKGVHINYDPTNGTTSRGNIFRTFKDPEKIKVLDEEE